MRPAAEWGVFFLIVTTAFPLGAQERADSLSPRLLPSEHLVHDFVADGTAHRSSAHQMFSPNEVHVSVGGIVPLVEYIVWNMPVQLSTGASIHARLDPGQSIAVLNSEFSVDFFLLDVQPADGLILRTGMGHASHHLGDGVPRDSAVQAVDYSRDDFQLFVICAIDGFSGELYAGFRYNYSHVVGRSIDKPLSFQFGMHALPWSFSQEFSAYVGLDMKLRQELSYGTSQRYELGLQYRTTEGRALRLAFSYSGGFEERGQFFGKRRSDAGIGVVLSL